jgi:hypothetical protein
METTEMISFLKHLVDDFHNQGEHFKFTSQDVDTIYAIALRMESMQTALGKLLIQTSGLQ